MRRLVGTMLALAGLLLLSFAPLRAAETDPFADLSGFVGKTWKGEGKGPDGKPVTDIARWEWALGGKAIRVTHSMADASYGGETMIFWDAPSKTLIYHYFTTAGFHTQGVMRADGPGRLIAEEEVKGHPKISRVRSTMVVIGDAMSSNAEYLSEGKWAPGHSFAYKQTEPSALPAFPKVR
ncbi:hypothetical protein [Niveispirillum sp. KHB5.9]|uniref:hypothetical protein n=1 Tax=Niveispirillum sp. KHB5.9 TaxID=3400269 RepID=UPI003A89C13D